ncbi:MAG: aminopeptidase [candidate division Zixibacteria bacterium]|nr:aminopeptidase [candidate division Zixibacteria bacterium]
MTDPRVTKLAKLLINYSLKLKKGHLIKIQGEVVSLPLIKAAYEEAVKVGAYPYVQVNIPDLEEKMLKYGSDDQLEFLSPVARFEADKVDALLVIWGSENTSYLTGTDPKRQALKQKGRGPILKSIFKRVADKSLNWVGTQFPTLADAQDAEMSLSDYEDFVYGAGHITSADPVKHWLRMEKEQMRLAKILDTLDQIHVLTNETDLRLRVKGRKWISCHGTENFPDGEIFTCPIEDSVEGHIRFSFPAVYGGREVQNVRLNLKKGRVVSETAGKNQDYLTAMLDMDRGARSVGEFAIGTNYEIKQFSRNILFDEKIGGTCHMAVGASIPEAGGKNHSALHWDMVCDLKQGGEITADRKIIYRNGKFTI